MTATETEFHRAAPAPGVIGTARRAPVLVAAAAVFVVIIVLLVVASRPQDYDELSIHNVTPTGTRAVAEILRDQGVSVRQTETLSSARIIDPAATTLAIAYPDLLLEYQVDSILDYPGDLVLVGVSPRFLSQIDAGLSVQITPTEVVSAQCSDPDAVAAESIEVSGSALRGATTSAEMCFLTDGGGAGYAVTEHQGRRIAMIASTAIVTNGALADHGHAALALRALGMHEQLVWHLSDPFDSSVLTWTGSAEGQQPPGEIEADPAFLPPWTGPVAYVLGLTLLIAAVWKGRRFGALVPEPLPVVVRGSESTRGRARLYRRTRASGRAAAALRAHTAFRMGYRLGLARSSPPSALVAAVARAASRHPSDVQRILYGPPPTTDDAMMTLIDELDALEREVHRP